MLKLIQGVGVNDYAGTVTETVNGKPKQFYAAWKSMLKRCYSSNYHAENPTYIGCIVYPEWLSLTKFKEWYDNNYVDGYHLDKDLLVLGNKVYGPDMCRYIPQELNKLLLDRAAMRGLHPQGVCFHKRSGKFQSRLRIDGKEKFLGYFDSPKQAEAVYKAAKSAEILRKVDQYHGVVDQGVLDSLTQIANNLIK